MILRKHTHPTVVLEKDGASLLIDPGVFTTDAPELIRDASVVLITHDHPDHADVDLLTAALDSQPDLKIWAPPSVANQIPRHGDRIRVVEPGGTGDAAGFHISVVGGRHESIHLDMPASGNVGYVIDQDVYHPGDSYYVPEENVTTLLVPLSGPFSRLDKIVDFIRAARPTRAIAIHDVLLTEMGKEFLAQFITPLAGLELAVLRDNDSVQI
ncbi:MBL fold metallo-hydrolase [Microbacterium sp. SL75]|uniref:MBL fold metallo-hydrolase n=1 Tax=Microbacterium sp. SL75 TaxID=2995140 RepID=UPI002270A5E4|nr:MBL fold metallo-hydrolase [Microbacterium sp. SL75]WAC70115.1 MBL fold metallo-hydrolase [Microbacterium sp. SL75]